MADKQAKRVYAWEWACEHYGEQPMGKERCKEFVRWACASYGVPIPAITVLDYDSADGSSYSPQQDRIRLTRRHRTPHICLHEAAHAIVEHYLGNENVEDHGPAWLGIYCWLLRRSKLASPKWISKSLPISRLRAWPSSKASPRALQRRASKKKRRRC